MKTFLPLPVAAIFMASLGNMLGDPSNKPREVYAVWYKVPRASLAQRRAGPNEFTAAHNRLPLGTLVRLTNPRNGRSVVVRITDRGIPRSRANIDMCKEAAESLGVLRDGIVRVRMEVLPATPPTATSDAGATVSH